MFKPAVGRPAVLVVQTIGGKEKKLGLNMSTKAHHSSTEPPGAMKSKLTQAAALSTLGLAPKDYLALSDEGLREVFVQKTDQGPEGSAEDVKKVMERNMMLHEAFQFLAARRARKRAKEETVDGQE